MSHVPRNEGKTSETYQNLSVFAYIRIEVGTHHHGLRCCFGLYTNQHDAIWVIVDRFTKSTHFLAIRSTFSLERLARLYINLIVKLHRVPVSIMSGRDPWFTSWFWPKL